MAQDAVFGKTSIKCTLECVDIVNALSDERAFAKDILIHVRNRARVLIDTGLTSVQPCIPRPVRARQAHGHTRLENAVT